MNGTLRDIDLKSSINEFSGFIQSVSEIIVSYCVCNNFQTIGFVEEFTCSKPFFAVLAVIKLSEAELGLSSTPPDHTLPVA